MQPSSIEILGFTLKPSRQLYRTRDCGKTLGIEYNIHHMLMHLSIASPAPGDPGIAGIRAGTYKLPM